MFTGIVEEMGTIQKIERGSQSAVLSIRCEKVLEGTQIGDSIAVNGVCLTVTSLRSDGYDADVMAETIRRSSLGSCKVGSQVNLERAMAADGRFGGHIVAGHVDGTGCILRIEKDDNAVWFTIHAEPNLLRYVVEKGSIAVDGISLTVAAVSSDAFSVSTIPHTVSCTNLCQKHKNDVVNLETDILGKYVEKLFQPIPQEHRQSSVTKEMLIRYGFE